MDVTYFVALPFAILSVLGEVTVILVSCQFHMLRKSYPYRLIYILAILDLIWSLSLCFPQYLINTSLSCNIQGFINQSFNIADTLWTSFMSYEMFSVVILRKEKLQFGYNKPLILILIISFTNGAFPIVFNCYELFEGWCWIDSKDPDKEFLVFIMRLFLYFVFVGFCFVWNLFVAWKVFFRLKVLISGEDHGLVRKIRYYPMIFVVIYVPIAINDFFYSVTWVPFEYFVFSCCVFALGGFLNAVVYGLTYEVKKLIIKGLFRVSSSFSVIIND